MFQSVCSVMVWDVLCIIGWEIDYVDKWVSMKPVISADRPVTLDNAPVLEQPQRVIIRQHRIYKTSSRQINLQRFETIRET